MKDFLLIIVCICSVVMSAQVFATDAPAALHISAFNAGYKDDISAQNYDFIELSRADSSDLNLGGVELRYFNSAGNLAGTITFTDNQILQSDRLVLGFRNSPQYASDDDALYNYYFSSSGLAATAGALQLWQGDQLLDEVCWGKNSCEKNVPKFATTSEANQSYVRGEDGLFVAAAYYPAIDRAAIREEVADVPSLCGELIVTEIYSYYIDSSAEQFVEIYNPSAETISLDTCALRYKNQIFPLAGQLRAEQYYVFQDSAINYTKNPSTFGTISILNASGEAVLDFVYPHGQKKGSSYALFNVGTTEEKWLQTYDRTPGLPNRYQQFQSCPEGKEINPETGNCVKSRETAEATSCPEGKYLNPLTGRCKKIETATVKICKDGYHLNILTGRCNKDKTASTTSECKEGYERNPDTGRCRKVRTNTAQEYPVAPSSDETYDSPQIFVAGGAIAALLIGGIGFALFQFRKEIKTAILKICRRNAS